LSPVRLPWLLHVKFVLNMVRSQAEWDAAHSDGGDGKGSKKRGPNKGTAGEEVEESK